MNNSKIPEKCSELIALMTRHKNAFSAADADLKLNIIKSLCEKPILSARQLIEYHDALCFIQAYPDNPLVSHTVDNELNSFSDRIALYKQRHLNDTRLDDTGIVDTPIFYPYNLSMARWLIERFGSGVEIDWGSYNERETDPLSGFFPLFSLYLENDGIDDEDLSAADWIKMAHGKGQTSLEWLLARLDNLNIPADVMRHLYNDAELMLRWELGRSDATRTLAKLRGRRLYYQRGSLKRGGVDLNRSIKRAVPDLKPVPSDLTGKIIETLIKALLPRHRELYPATFANPDEVYITGPGRGLDIYILGMNPENRMPLESNYSALLIKNGVPIGYGIAVFFFDRCELAINVFDTFRSGEASIIFEHFAKIFYHHFGARDFIMRKWQVGYDNEEGLKSGSYWFYYKLGFRSIDPKVNDLASAEWLKIQKNKQYRSDIKTLKLLAQSDLYFSPGRNESSPFSELSVISLGLAVTRMVAERFDGDRQAAQCWSTEHIAELLSIDINDWTSVKRLQFERFAPLLTLIKDIDSWSKSEKHDVVSIINAKAASKEIEYIQALQRHAKLFSALQSIDSSN